MSHGFPKPAATTEATRHRQHNARSLKHTEFSCEVKTFVDVERDRSAVDDDVRELARDLERSFALVVVSLLSEKHSREQHTSTIHVMTSRATYPAVRGVGAVANALDPRAHLGLAVHRHVQRLLVRNVNAEQKLFPAATARQHV